MLFDADLDTMIMMVVVVVVVDFVAVVVVDMQRGGRHNDQAEFVLQALRRATHRTRKRRHPSLSPNSPSPLSTDVDTDDGVCTVVDEFAAVVEYCCNRGGGVAGDYDY